MVVWFWKVYVGPCTDWMYLHKFSSNFRKNWSDGNGLVVRDHLELLVDGGYAVIVSEMEMCDRGEVWVVGGRAQA